MGDPDLPTSRGRKGGTTTEISRSSEPPRGVKFSAGVDTIRRRDRTSDLADPHDEREQRADYGRDRSDQGGTYSVVHTDLQVGGSRRRTRRSPWRGSQLAPSGLARCLSSVAVATGMAVPTRTRRALASRASVGKQNRTTSGAVAARARPGETRTSSRRDPSVLTG
jgi:hypothetical protein